MGGVGSGKKLNLSDEEKRDRNLQKKKEWTEKNRKYYLQQQKEWRIKNRELQLQHNKKWQAENKEYFNSLKKQWRDENKDKIHLTYKAWYQKKKEKILKKYLWNMKYERKNPDRNKRYYAANRDKVIAKAKEYREKQRMRKAA